MAELQDLTRKRANAKRDVDLELGFVAPLLKVSPDDANDQASRINDSMKKVESLVKVFKAAHKAYVEKIKENATGDEEEMDITIGECDTYLKEVEGRVYQVLGWYNDFKFKLQVPDLSTKLSKKFKVYKREKSKVELATNKFDNVPEETLRKSLTVKLVDAVILQETIREAFEEVNDAVDKLKSVSKKAKINFEEELRNIDVTIDQNFEDQFLRLDNKLSTLCRIQNLEKHFGGSSSGNSSDHPRASPIKLEKAETIKFSGEPRDFATFKREFNEIIVPNRDITEVSLRLKQAVPKKHLHLIERFKLDQYQEMMAELEKKFGGSRQIVTSVMKQLERMKVPQRDEQFRDLIEQLQKIERDMEEVDMVSSLAQESILLKYEDLLPEKVSSNWLEYAAEKKLLNNSTALDRYHGFMEFLKYTKDQVEWNISKNEALPASAKSKFCFVTGRTFSTSAKEVPPEKTSPNPRVLHPCLACHDGSTNMEVTRHSMATCAVWNNLTLNQKKNKVNCVKHPFAADQHKTSDCKRNIGACKECSKVNDHHFLLCPKKTSKTSMASTKCSSSDSEVILKTMFVKTKSGESIGVIEDNCSTDNYITHQKAKELKLKGEDVVLEIEGINTTEQIDSKIYKVPIRDLKKNLHYLECYGLDEITKDSVPLNPEKYKMICDQFGIKTSEVKRPTAIHCMISAKSNHLMSDQVIKEVNGLKLYAGPLGKTISGNIVNIDKEHCQVYPTSSRIVISSVKKAKIIKTLTDKQILEHFREESIGAECNPKCGNCECGQCALGTRQMSIKEERDYQRAKDNMFLDVEGTPDDPGPYWRTQYPWNIPREELADNYEAVLGVMNSTTRKLSKDPAWRETYEKQLKELIDLKVAREISKEELDSWSESGNKHYYIAHQMALNPASKTTPVRTVFNSSQVYKGSSLNSCLDLGPHVTNNLHGILMRFREDKVAAQGDIRKMFYAVRVTKEEEFMQLFIWRFKGEQNIRTFAMTRLVMGNKPSSNCSGVALRETAFLEDNDQKYPRAARALTRDSYVDNTFVTSNSVPNIQSAISEVEHVAGVAGFSYKPWVVSGDNVPDQLLVNAQDVDEEKALGVHWKVKEDELFVKVGNSSKSGTMKIGLTSIIDNPEMRLSLRECLSLHAKAFDPSGLVLPVKMVGNLLFRQTLQYLSLRGKQLNQPRSGLPWDMEVDGKLKERWIEYFSMLESLADVKFPRSLKPENADENIPPFLATFSDGNEDAFGTCAYAVWTLKDGTREARLIMAKAKLGPLLNKGETVKNELAGATFAVRLKTFIISNTGLNYSEFVPFLDSRIVQDMIKKDSYVLNTFAGLRVKEIAAKSDVSSWRHISSKDNHVADILTRGATPDKIGPGSDWQTGPSWLTQDPETWPVTNVEVTKAEREVMKTFERVTRTFISSTSSGSRELHRGPGFVSEISSTSSGSRELHGGPGFVPEIEEVIENGRSLNQIVNTVAFSLRLAGRGADKRRISKDHLDLNVKEKYDANPISASEHDDALKTIIEHEQTKLDSKSFKGFDLVEKEFVLNSGKILKLVVLKSRVQNYPSSFADQSQDVFVLPNATFAKLLAQHYHDKHHRSVDTVVTIIRSEFWIPQIRRIVSNIDKKCKICLIERQKVSGQLMGALPDFRSTPTKAFSSVSLDMFGPLTIRDSVVKKGARVRKKVWGVLVVCNSTRAVYLDVAEDYSTESILHVIRRLMSDKGQVSQIISDPGTQLKGAANELENVRKGWNESDLVRFGASQGLEWKFTMAASHHQAGAVEIMIKICKGIMRSLMNAIGTTVLFLNELFTLMKEVANLANERPIGLKPNSQSDTQYLSPNCLLLGRCSDRINSGPFQDKTNFDHDPETDRTRFLLVQKITDQFWKNWTNLYFPTLLRRQKWHHKERNMTVGDVCVMKDSNAMRGEWRLCRVAEVYPDKEGVVRNVKVIAAPPGKTDGSSKYNKDIAMVELKRHVSNFIVIHPQADGVNDDDTGHGRVCTDGSGATAISVSARANNQTNQ